MRRAVLASAAVGAVALLGSGCGSNASGSQHSATPSPPTLPRIHEAFTTLPCPAKDSTATALAIEGCAEQEILLTDREIEARARQAFAHMTPSGRRSLAAAERTWLTYRRSFCNARASLNMGGSLAPVAFAQCEVDVNASHLESVSALVRDLTSG